MHPSPKTCRLAAGALPAVPTIAAPRPEPPAQEMDTWHAPPCWASPASDPSVSSRPRLETHWAGRTSADEVEAVARRLRAAHLDAGREAGIDVLPVGDFALYDHVLDTAAMAGLVAERHRGLDPFAAARGADGVRPLELTKWFDTNYHYLVPELEPGAPPALDAAKWIAHLAEAEALGAGARPVVLGPFSLLLLSKGGADPLALLPALTDVYAELLAHLAQAGAREVQLDEPCLVLDRTDAELDAFATAYARLLAPGAPAVCLATYFAGLPATALARVAALAPAELHLDLVRDPGQLVDALAVLPETTRLSAGVVDGRNVWATDPDRALDLLDRAAAALGTDRLSIAPSCSLLHVPYSAARETRLDPELRGWLAFGQEKLDELVLLRRALDAGRGARRAARGRAGARREPARLRAHPRPARAEAGRAAASRGATARHAARRARRASSASGSGCRSCRPRRSGRSPRPRRSATRARGIAPARSAMRATSTSSPQRSSMRSASRSVSASTCSCTASRSATTWSSTSASGSTASRSPRTAGCSPTAAAA